MTTVQSDRYSKQIEAKQKLFEVLHEFLPGLQLNDITLAPNDRLSSKAPADRILQQIPPQRPLANAPDSPMYVNGGQVTIFLSMNGRNPLTMEELKGVTEALHAGAPQLEAPTFVNHANSQISFHGTIEHLLALNWDAVRSSLRQVHADGGFWNKKVEDKKTLKEKTPRDSSDDLSGFVWLR